MVCRKVGLCRIQLNTVMSFISFGHEVADEIVSLNTAKILFQIKEAWPGKLIPIWSNANARSLNPASSRPPSFNDQSRRFFVSKVFPCAEGSNKALGARRVHFGLHLYALGLVFLVHKGSHPDFLEDPINCNLWHFLYLYQLPPFLSCCYHFSPFLLVFGIFIIS